MRVTLLVYMVVILRFVEFPVSCSGHTGEAKREAPPPKAEALHLRRVRRRRKP
jgi:hypothetical protein